ncbi:MAG TPA: sigma-70 family RNA polymerase sigma factor [Thermoanaerobaculia bacterium]|nr:sigma-70 family RNA polymerase sigma factor [Thermoanaerobaculia bacterium]
MDPQPSPDPGSNHELTAAYEENYGLLLGIAVDRFGIPYADAETLVQEIFLQLLLHASRVRDRRAWLIGAVYNASKGYLRSAQRVQPLPGNASSAADPRYVRVEEQWPAELAVREVFERMTPRCQLALRLRYIEGHTLPSIARLLDTTTGYATKLVNRCLEAAHRLYGGSGK